MLIRSRSARLAALALAAATPVVAFCATPAFADPAGVVHAEMTEQGLHIWSDKGLSRTTIVFCEGDPLVIPSWPGTLLDTYIDVDGPIRAVFIHSGNNTTDAAETLLQAIAPSAYPGNDSNSTGAIAIDTPCVPETPVVPPVVPPETPVTPSDPSDPVISIASDPAPVTSVLGVTIERPADPAPAPAVVVSGDTLEAAPGGELPRTGAGNMPLEAALAMFLIAAGVTMQAFGRRNRSASFPG